MRGVLNAGRARAGAGAAGISHEGKKERSLLLLRPDGCKEVGKGGIEGGGPTRSGRRLGSHSQSWRGVLHWLQSKMLFSQEGVGGREEGKAAIKFSLPPSPQPRPSVRPSVRPRPSDRVLLIRSGFDCGRRRQKAERAIERARRLEDRRRPRDRPTDRPTPPFLSPRRESRRCLRCEPIERRSSSVFYSFRRFCRRMRFPRDSLSLVPPPPVRLEREIVMRQNTVACPARPRWHRHRVPHPSERASERATTIRNQCFRSERRDVASTVYSATRPPARLPVYLISVARCHRHRRHRHHHRSFPSDGEIAIM